MARPGTTGGAASSLGARVPGYACLSRRPRHDLSPPGTSIRVVYPLNRSGAKQFQDELLA
jgi:hypothetical protein